MLTGVTFLPLEVMIRSFLRPVMATKPSSSTEPRSPECSQPSSRERLLGGRRVVEVALEHMWPADQDLAVRGDRHLGARQRPPDGAEAQRVGGVERGRGARLGQAVALEHQHAAGVEELAAARGATGAAPTIASSQAGPERLADLGEHQAVGEPVLQVGQQPRLLALAQRWRRARAPQRRAQLEQRSLRPRAVGHPSRRPRRGPSRRCAGRRGNGSVRSRPARR